MTTTALSRDEILAGLRDIIHRLQAAGQPATIQLVGGVAIALTIDGDRPPTRDVDAAVTPPAAFRKVAAEVGEERSWPDGWLDERASIFLPNQYGRGTEWVTLYDHGGVVVQAGDPKMLLAMKLVAVGTRPRRDADDVAVLLSATGVATADEAEEILEEYFPGDGLPPRVYAIVEALLEQGPRTVRTPEPPDFT
ncbi:hypothetical protein [Microbacterium sp.]|uniref:hypothetical protein n=1 Tax=Microbacterium sp. TaxID=51671 RepID=UPI003A909924